MLKGTKSVSLSFQSVIHDQEKGDQIAVYMSAQIPESGRSNSSKTIQDLNLYEANKAECRADMAAFDEMLWELEDQAAAVDVPETEDTAGETDGQEGVTDEN